jgi:hypothetical protein
MAGPNETIAPAREKITNPSSFRITMTSNTKVSLG